MVSTLKIKLIKVAEQNLLGIFNVLLQLPKYPKIYSN